MKQILKSIIKDFILLNLPFYLTGVSKTALSGCCLIKEIK